MQNLRWEQVVEVIEGPIIDWSAGQGAQLLHNLTSRRTFRWFCCPASFDEIPYFVVQSAGLTQIMRRVGWPSTMLHRKDDLKVILDIVEWVIAGEHLERDLV